MTHGPTVSAEHALSVTEEWRAAALRDGRVIAVDLCLKHGEVHSRLVLDEMERLGKLPPPEEGKKGAQYRWVGAVFLGGFPRVFRNTGRVHKVHDPKRRIHRGRGCAIWELIPDADLTAYGHAMKVPMGVPSYSAQPEVPFNRARALAALQRTRAMAVGMGASPELDAMEAWLRGAGKESP